MSCLKLTEVTVLLISACLISISWAHQGHDNDDDNEHSHGLERIPENDPVWINARSVPFPEGSGFDLRWLTEDKNKSLKMKMKAKTEGYVAVGFCSVWHGTMEGCDIVLGWVDNSNSNTSVHLHDYFATGNSKPQLDEKQNYEIVSGEQKDGFTSIVFKRLMNTEDANNDSDLSHNDVHVIYAWSTDDPTSSQAFMKHDMHGRGHTSKPVAFKIPDEKVDDHSDHHHHSGSVSVACLTQSWIIVCQIIVTFGILYR